MGNTLPDPVVTASDVTKYRREIRRYHRDFQPIMSVMLTSKMTIKKLRAAYRAGARVLKLIPGNTSTGSAQGIALADLKKYYPVLREAKRLGMIFSGHWELIADPATNQPIHRLSQEERAIPFLADVVRSIPGLRIIAEHCSTRKLIEFVKNVPYNVGGTLAVHHATATYWDAFSLKDEIRRPELYCKPCLKPEDDRQAVVEAMVSGNPKFFFGSDSAPWHKDFKKGRKSQAGIFTPYKVYMSRLMSIFEKNNALDKLEAFLCIYGPLFYKLEPIKGEVRLQRVARKVQKYYKNIPVFCGGEILEWIVV